VSTRKFAASADLAPASSSPASGVRGAIDSLVQGSLVELFAAYGISVAPLPRMAPERVPTVPEVSAAVGFACQGVTGQPGRITLSLPGAVLDRMKNDSGNTLKGDWTRELANQLIGRIKNRLLQFSVRLPSTGHRARACMRAAPCEGRYWSRSMVCQTTPSWSTLAGSTWPPRGTRSSSERPARLLSSCAVRGILQHPRTERAGLPRRRAGRRKLVEIAIERLSDTLS
jgi:hypothetical protein